MSEQAQDLARRFIEMHGTVIAAVERCSPTQWAAPAPEGGWPLAMAAYHVALVEGRTADLIRAIVAGHPIPPLTMEIIEERNAQDAREHAGCTHEETLALLRQNGRQAAEVLGGLSDEQLQRTTAGPLFGRSWTTAEVAEAVVLGHLQGHLADFQVVG